jgi:hypothetical protein
MQALLSNTIGLSNTALGMQALVNNISGNDNTASGMGALLANNTGSSNVANGRSALSYNTSGCYNIAIGVQALYNNTTASNNTAVGSEALYENTLGTGNTALGFRSLYFTQNGNSNTALGHYAGYLSGGQTLNQCTFVGANSYPTISRTNVTMLGYGVANAQCTADNQVLLGNTAITEIRAQVTGITAYSDARLKTNIKENVSGIDFIMKLKPVTYNQNPEVLHQIWGTPDSISDQIDHSDINNIRFIGFLAQDVEKAATESGFDFPGIDVPQNANEVYSLRYTDFIMPLVKATQEQQVIIETQQTEIESQRVVVENLQKQIDELRKLIEGM